MARKLEIKRFFEIKRRPPMRKFLVFYLSSCYQFSSKRGGCGLIKEESSPSPAATPPSYIPPAGVACWIRFLWLIPAKEEMLIFRWKYRRECDGFVFHIWLAKESPKINELTHLKSLPWTLYLIARFYSWNPLAWYWFKFKHWCLTKLLLYLIIVKWI